MNNLSRFSPLTVLSCYPNSTWVLTDQDRIQRPSFQVPVADTTGAGDALAGGFLGEWFKTRQPARSLVADIRLASEVVQRVGTGPMTGPAED